MAVSFLRRSVALSIRANPIISKACNLYSQAFRNSFEDNEVNSSVMANKQSNGGAGFRVASSNHSSRVYLSPLLLPGGDHSSSLDIELVDPSRWQVSSSLSHAWGETEEISNSLQETVGEPNHFETVECDADFEEIEDMRLRGNLFYKLDKDSREFKECNVNFRRKNSSKKSKEKQTKVNKIKESNISSTSTGAKSAKRKNSDLAQEIGKSRIEVGSVSRDQLERKKKRNPTFNQLTAPYHEPFCLDIYISKSSVRACIVHRVTSKVVVVAHSISKDLKHDLASTKDSTACVAIGGVLAQRAIADDIHNVVYTPRKGEKLEGKLQAVLQSIIDDGINVKVKIKQRRHTKKVSL